MNSLFPKRVLRHFSTINASQKLLARRKGAVNYTAIRKAQKAPRELCNLSPIDVFTPAQKSVTSFAPEWAKQHPLYDFVKKLETIEQREIPKIAAGNAFEDRVDDYLKMFEETNKYAVENTVLYYKQRKKFEEPSKTKVTNLHVLMGILIKRYILLSPYRHAIVELFYCDYPYFMLAHRHEIPFLRLAIDACGNKLGPLWKASLASHLENLVFKYNEAMVSVNGNLSEILSACQQKSPSPSKMHEYILFSEAFATALRMQLAEQEGCEKAKQLKGLGLHSLLE